MRSAIAVKAFTFSLTGYLHAKNKEPCQDFCIYSISDQCAVAALADGAGSAKFSHIGAKIATTTFTGYFTAKPDRIFEEPENVIDRIRRNLERNAKKRGAGVSEFSSTLIGAVFYDSNLFLLHIGDGKALLLSDSGAEVLSNGKKGEFSNETYFTTSKDPKVKVVKKITTPSFSIVLMSDGASLLFFDSRERKPAPILHRILTLMDTLPQQKIKRDLRRAVKALPPHRWYDDISLAILKFGGEK